MSELPDGLPNTCLDCSEQEISTLPDGTVRMCLTEDGITACTYVSSHHLVEDKWGYLKESIRRQAERAYEQPC